jgi:hypothetical protein
MLNIAEGLGLQPQRTANHSAESSQRIAQRHGWGQNHAGGEGTDPAANLSIMPATKFPQSC